MTNDKPTSNNVNSKNQITSKASGGELPQKQILKAFKTTTTTTKTISDAFLKVKTYRDNINSGYECWLADDLSSMVYVFERGGKVFARGYRGRAKKAAFYSRFTSEESRTGFVAKWMGDRSANQQETEDRRKLTPRAVEIGDILYDSWGWEQTNVSYYKVLELVGNHSVIIIEVGHIADYDNVKMSGTCTPDIDIEIGKPFTRRVSNGTCIKVNSVIRASKLEYTIEDGNKKYKSSYFSTYA